MSIKWWEKVSKLFCVIPATFDAVQNIICQYARSAYAKRCFPGIQFKPLAYATADCEFEVPCRIWEYSRLSSVKMGRHSYCGEGCLIVHATIGRFCSIGNEVIIGTWLHPTHLVSTFPGFYSSSKHTINLRQDENIKQTADVFIGNDVWIGHRAILFGGITIGDGAIIGAGAIVTKDVAPYAVVAGVPARTLRKRFQQSTVDHLLKLRWWDYDDETLRKYSDLFGDPDAFLDGFAK